MTSTIHADKIMNSSGDQDSGVDLQTNDQVKLKTANTDRVTVTDATTSISNDLNVDSNTLFVDASTNKVHIGNTSDGDSGGLSVMKDTGSNFITHFRNTNVNPYGVKISAPDGDNSGYPLLYIGDHASTEYFKVQNNGAVTTPNQPLSFVRYAGNTEHGAYSAGGSRNNIICKPTNVVINQGSNFATNSGTFTCPVAGIYRVSFGGNHYGNGVSSYFFIFIRKNGTAVDTVYTKALTTDWQQITRTSYISCAANDTLTITNENDGTSGGGSKGGWDVTTYSYFSFSLVM